MGCEECDMYYFLLAIVKAIAEIYFKTKYFIFKARHGFNPTPEDIEAYFVKDLKNAAPMTPWDHIFRYAKRRQ